MSLLDWIVPAAALRWDQWDSFDGFLPELPADLTWYAIPEERPTTQQERYMMGGSVMFTVNTGRWRHHLGQWPPPSPW